MDELVVDRLLSYGIDLRRNPTLALPLVVSVLVGVFSLIALVCWPKKNRPASKPVSAADQPPPPGEHTLICRVCQVRVPQDLAAIHRGGRRHQKRVAADASKADVFTWVPTAEWRAAHPDQFVERDKDDGEDGEPERAAVAAAGTRSGGAAGGDTLKLQGRNVAVVAAAEATADELSGGGWEKAGSGKSKGKSKGGSDAGGGGGAGGKEILSSLVHLEGGRNMLEGLVIWNRFLTPGSESVLLSWVDAAITAGQSNKLRGSTYTAARDGRGLTLNYGAMYDPATGGIDVSKTVEPLPSAFRDVATRLAGDAVWKMVAVGEDCNAPRVPDSATVVVLEAGQHMPPHRTHGPAFGRPVFMLGLAGEEDLLLSMGIRPVQGAPGEYLAGFAQRIGRRSLLAFSGTAGTFPEQAVPSVRSRFVLIYLRCLAPSLREQMIARGNILQ